MCYAIPGRVVAFEGNRAVIDYFGERRRAINEIKNLSVGDYAYAQGGFVIAKVPEEEARQTLDAWKELFFELKKRDDSFSRAPEEAKLEKFVRKAENGNIARKEILSILKTPDRDLNNLFSTANSLRKESLENACCVHGIIEFSNHCRNDCFYCGLRKSNARMSRYRMTVEEIANAAEHAVNDLGFRALVLQSGEDPFYTPQILEETISKIRERCDALLFMSVGTRSRETYERMYNAGARGILLRFETSNRRLYSSLHHGRKADFDERLSLIRHCKEIGYIVATGFMIGLPGQTLEDLADDILLTRELRADMWSFGPFIQHPQTPLASCSPPDLNLALKVIAASRFADRNAKILVTTALETLHRDGKRKGLLAGANSLMINVTPRRYRENYTIYPGRPDRDKEIERNISETVELLHSIGRAPTDLGV